MKKRLSPHKKALAEKRAADLWAYYNQTGRLSRADVERITGTQYAGVMQTFRVNEITAPPIYDSREEQYREKAEALWARAKELKQGYLTVKQAAGSLGIKKSEVGGMEVRLRKAGFDLPLITSDKKNIRSPVDIEGERGYYPKGLQVLRCWPGPKKGQITYLLR